MTLAPLAANGCLSLCSWHRTDRLRAGRRLFRCSGCGSEWDTSQEWKPADADGSVAPEVDAAVQAEMDADTSSGQARR